VKSVIESFMADRPIDAAKIDRLLAGHAFPLAEDRDVTFVYRGPGEAICLRHFIYGLPTSQPFRRVEDTDLWFVVMQLPEFSRVEYKIERSLNGNTEWIMDPLNDRVAHDPFGANSVCYGAGYETPVWCRPDEDARRGSVERLLLPSRVFGQSRSIQIYLPARFRRRRSYPLLLVHDGSDYMRYSSLIAVLDNLIHRLEIPPLIVAMMDPGDRLVEYAADPRHARHVTEEILPELERRYPLIRRPEARALMGASFGAVAALSTAWHNPGLYGRLVLQSGSFGFSDIGKHSRGPAFDPVVEFVNTFRENPGKPSDRIFQSCGIYESLIYENRSLLPLLQATGMRVRYAEARDGHNWENWRDRLQEGLSWVFPGPLWMVYE
jgi:enterochelin esterase family protein